MKRLAAFAVVAALFALPTLAQRGGAHSGFSGSHAGGGVSAPRGGISGTHVSAPPFHGGSSTFLRNTPPRFAGVPGGSRGLSFQPPSIRPPARLGGAVPGQFNRPPLSISHRMPYAGAGLRPVAPIAGAPHRLNPTPVSHRMPYHSPHGGEHHGDGWNHGGQYGHGHDRHHHHYGFYGVYGWTGYPLWPWYGWGYPYLPSYWPSYWDSSDHYDSEPASNYAASQYPEYAPGPYEATQPDQAEPEQPEPGQPSYPPWPYSKPAPDVPQAAAAPSGAAPVTLIFKDGRPNEEIQNYLLTAKTLSVLDQHPRDIPVDQIDLAATGKVNRDAGVEFAIPDADR